MFALAAKLFVAYLLPVSAVLAPYEVWVTPKSGAPKLYSASESKETADAVVRVLTKSGPMRVILGKNGEVYFTGDHYDSFYKVK